MEDIAATYSKKQLIEHMRSIAPPEFLAQHKISTGKPWDKMTKEAVVAIFRELDGGKGADASAAKPPAAKPPAAAAAGAAAPKFNFNLGGAPPPASGLTNMFAPDAGAAGAAAGAFQFNFNLGSGGKKGEEEEDDEGGRGRGARQGAKKGAKPTAAALASGLGNLTVGGAVSSGSTAEDDVRIKALKTLQAAQDEAQEEYERACDAAEKALDEATKPLAAKRKAIVTGAAAADGAKAAEPIANFWLTCFQNHPKLLEEVHPCDEPLLKLLRDIELTRELPDGHTGFQLRFEFAPNDWFNDKVLTKTYLMDEDDDDTLDDVVGCSIDWKEGKNFTVRTVTKKQKKKGKERTVTIDEPVPSFFSFFAPPKLPAENADLDDEEAELLQDTLEADYAVACILRDKIVPDAVNWYTGTCHCARASARRRPPRARSAGAKADAPLFPAAAAAPPARARRRGRGDGQRGRRRRQRGRGRRRRR
jgi:nucleosome assembly protein 1-like 1